MNARDGGTLRGYLYGIVITLLLGSRPRWRAGPADPHGPLPHNHALGWHACASCTGSNEGTCPSPSGCGTSDGTTIPWTLEVRAECTKLAKSIGNAKAKPVVG